MVLNKLNFNAFMHKWNLQTYIKICSIFDFAIPDTEVNFYLSMEHCQTTFEFECTLGRVNPIIFVFINKIIRTSILQNKKWSKKKKVSKPHLYFLLTYRLYIEQRFELFAFWPPTMQLRLFGSRRNPEDTNLITFKCVSNYMYISHTKRF